jgi:GNAT superfamily N-acetyltransferase
MPESARIEIFRAGERDAEALTRIAFAAKRYWGYPERWIERWRESLTITPEFVRRNEVYAAVVEGEPVGFYALTGEGREIELEHLWVLPERMGTGVGRALFYHAGSRADSLGAETLSIESDPNAEGFYRRMGARRVGEINYSIDGKRRTLPLLVVDVRGHRLDANNGSSIPRFEPSEPRGADGRHRNEQYRREGTHPQPLSKDDEAYEGGDGGL